VSRLRHPILYAAEPDALVQRPRAAGVTTTALRSWALTAARTLVRPPPLLHKSALLTRLVPVVAKNWWRYDDRAVLSKSNAAFGPGHASFLKDRSGTPYVVVSPHVHLRVLRVLTPPLASITQTKSRAPAGTGAPFALRCVSCACTRLWRHSYVSQSFGFNPDHSPAFAAPAGFNAALPMPA
jgi:hypothetical protein